MSSIPLDLQRRFEQRWAARFRPKAPNAAEKHQFESQGRQPAPPSKAKEKLTSLSRQVSGLRRRCKLFE
jgi:hypothetical protein